MSDSGAAVRMAKEPDTQQKTVAQNVTEQNNANAVLDVVRQMKSLSVLELTNRVSVPHQELDQIISQLEGLHLVRVSDRDTDDPIVTIREQGLRA